MVQGKMVVIKYLMFAFNLLFSVIGLGLIIIGAIAAEKYGGNHSGIIVMGVTVFTIASIGCCGAIKENYCMLMTFFVFTGIIFLLQLIAVIVGLFKFDNASSEAWERVIKNYGNKHQPEVKKILDWVQQKLECCGENGPTDFNNATSSCGMNKGVASCHEESYCFKRTMYYEGCKKKIIVLVGAITAGTSFIQLLAMIFAGCLIKNIKRGYKQLVY